jgi:hypothetical protein
MFDTIYAAGAELCDSSLVAYMNEYSNMVKVDIGHVLATMTYGVNGNCSQYTFKNGCVYKYSTEYTGVKVNNGVKPHYQRHSRVSTGNTTNEMCPCFLSFENKHIDALQRYNSWGQRILRAQFKTNWNESSKPSVYWVVVIALILAILLVLVLGFKVWLLAVIIVLILILIISSKVATG